ncbi:MAG: nucleotidyltransferase family protein [Verrucomicrobiota bacterium]
MKALILAAGKGTRMRELTKSVPKPMIEVWGKPILQHIIEGLRDKTAIRDFFIITGFQAEIIEAYFGSGSSFNVCMHYGRQEVVNGTGKAPEVAKEWIGDSPFILVYGDILVDQTDYANILEVFTHDGVITVRKGENLKSGGAAVFNNDFFLKDLVEKAKPGTVSTPWYNAGIYAFKPALFKYTATLEKSPRGEYELTDAIRSMAQDGLKIKGLELKGHWADVRDPEVLAQLNASNAMPKVNETK